MIVEAGVDIVLIGIVVIFVCLAIEFVSDLFDLF